MIHHISNVYSDFRSQLIVKIYIKIYMLLKYAIIVKYVV